MSSRAREPRKKVTGIMRMDAALDAMRQIGFGTKLIRKTVQELLHVYGGSQGWPFIEETSYKLLIETLLSKQEGSAVKDKDGVDDVIPSSGISEVGSCELMSEDTVLHNSTQDGLNSSSQVSDQGNASPANLETDVRDVALQAVGGIPEQGMNNSKHKQKAADNVKGSHDSTIIKGVKIAPDKVIMIPSSKVVNPPPNHMREAYHGWIGNGSDEDKEYVHFPIPHLSEQIEKMIGQYVAPRSNSSRRRKSRWDEKPECM